MPLSLLYYKRKMLKKRKETFKSKLYFLHQCIFQSKDNDDHDLVHKYRSQNNEPYQVTCMLNMLYNNLFQSYFNIYLYLYDTL